MPTFHDYLAQLGDGLLRDLGPAAPPWRVSDVRWDPTGAAPPDELADMSFDVTSLYDDSAELLVLRDSEATVLVTFQTGHKRTAYQVAVPVFTSPVRAIAEYASQLQDHVVESSEGWGLPLPPCPRHEVHPLSARFEGARAGWHCPQDGARVRDIPDR